MHFKLLYMYSTQPLRVCTYTIYYLHTCILIYNVYSYIMYYYAPQSQGHVGAYSGYRYPYQTPPSPSYPYCPPPNAPTMAHDQGVVPPPPPYTPKATDTAVGENTALPRTPVSGIYIYQELLAAYELLDVYTRMYM